MSARSRLSATDLGGLKGVNAANGTVATDLATKGQVDTAETNAKSRANHTGTQNAATISDFDTQVRTNRLDQMTAPTGSVSLNTQKITALLAGTADTDAVNLGQLKDLLSGARKTDVRFVTTTNDSLSGLAARDGVTPVGGDRVLVTGQSSASANGVYVAASGAWSRASDADNAAEFATQWLVTVREGTVNGDTLWQHNTDGTVTLGTTALSFAKIGPISSSTNNGHTSTSPAVSAGANWDVAHGLGSRAYTWQVYRTASPFDDLDAYGERLDLNTLRIKPDVALASGEFTVVISPRVV